MIQARNPDQDDLQVGFIDLRVRGARAHTLKLALDISESQLSKLNHGCPFRSTGGQPPRVKSCFSNVERAYNAQLAENAYRAIVPNKSFTTLSHRPISEIFDRCVFQMKELSQWIDIRESNILSINHIAILCHSIAEGSPNLIRRRCPNCKTDFLDDRRFAGYRTCPRCAISSRIDASFANGRWQRRGESRPSAALSGVCQDSPRAELSSVACESREKSPRSPAR